MKPPSYQKTPAGIMEVLTLFWQHNLQYILFKCDHIFAGQNKNLDILFETNEDYHQAAALLEQQGFVIRLSEKIEKYKTMYCGLIMGTMYSIHLHREIAWHGMIALDKKTVFSRVVKIHHMIAIPSLEDSILIHAAHVLFENFKVKEKEKNYFLKLDGPSINKEYIRWQIRKNHWKKGFWKVIKSEELSITTIMFLWMEKLYREPGTMLYLLRKAVRIPLRKLSFKRRGCLIALIGVNGSGKSTLAKKVLEEYQPITTHLGKEQHYYYYGWKPTFILTRWISMLLKKNQKEIFKEVYIKARPRRFDLFQEMQFLYIYFEFLYRYYVKIRPLLKKEDLVVTDRYFYDIYGQYPYAKQSRIARPLLALFPRPDKTYVLDADITLLASRSKTDKFKIGIQPTKRTILPVDYLQQQRINYQELAPLFSFTIINTSHSIQKNINKILGDSWRECL